MKERRKRHIPFKILFTGQHKDYDNGADFRINFIQYGENRLDNIIQNCLNLPTEWFYDITHILVQGDTTSVLGLSIMAMHRKIKVIHLEAGLRSYDYENPYPEEYNRVLASKIADVHLCPTNRNKLNLTQEGINPDKIYVVGNTGLDNLLEIREQCEYTNKILVTLHRRENHDKLTEWFNQVNNLAIEYPQYEFILPLHPNPFIKECLPISNSFTIIEPQEHEDLLAILSKCRLVITDSGGIQEESSFLYKKCLVCRKTTERNETLHISSFLVKEPDDLIGMFKKHIDKYVIKFPSPFGKGHSSETICELLSYLLIQE